MEEKDLNFNYSECVKSYDSWGTTHYVNICNGVKNDVPWGVSGHFALVGVIILVLVGVAFLAVLIRIVFEEI